jgi:hypothetical protein
MMAWLAWREVGVSIFTVISKVGETKYEKDFLIHHCSLFKAPQFRLTHMTKISALQKLRKLVMSF